MDGNILVTEALKEQLDAIIALIIKAPAPTFKKHTDDVPVFTKYDETPMSLDDYIF